jgi:uncharacterized protein YndB with AHSA1/START domain
VATTFKIEVAATPEQVFDYLADVRRHPEWANPKAKMAAEQIVGDGPGQGAAYKTHALFVNKPVTADVQVTAFERPRKFAIRSDQHQEGKKDVWYENEFTLTRSAGGTVISKHTTSNGNPVVGVVAYPAIRGDALTSLRNLKSKLEA